MVNSIIVVALISFGLMMLVIGSIAFLVARVVQSCYYKRQIKKKRHLKVVK